MAYPPQAIDLPVNSTNDQGMQDYHPTLHNHVNQAVLDVTGVLGTNPATGTSAISFNTIQDRLDWIQSHLSTGVITGTASGIRALTGAYPDPDLTPGYVRDSHVNTANKDGAPGVPSLRTLGSGSQQAVAGNDLRLSDARPPTGAAGGVLQGTFPSPQLGSGVITPTNIASSALDGLPGTPSLRTLGTGGAQACAGNDARLTNARTPTGTAGGSLTGTYPNPALTIEGVWHTATMSNGLAWTATVANPGLGNGFLEMRYQLLGKLLIFQYILQWGSTTNGGSGRWNFGLPIDPVRGQLQTPVGGGTLSSQVVAAWTINLASFNTGFQAGNSGGAARIPGGSTNFQLAFGVNNTLAGVYNGNVSPTGNPSSGDQYVWGGIIEIA